MPHKRKAAKQEQRIARGIARREEAAAQSLPGTTPCPKASARPVVLKPCAVSVGSPASLCKEERPCVGSPASDAKTAQEEQPKLLKLLKAKQELNEQIKQEYLRLHQEVEDGDARAGRTAAPAVAGAVTTAAAPDRTASSSRASSSDSNSSSDSS